VLAFREVTVRRRMERELQVTKSTLEAANERLRELDTARSRFLNTAAHELRIPVTIVNGYCSLLRETGTDNLTSQQREYLHAAVESSDRLVDLINNMLDLSRFEAGKMLLDIDIRDLQAVVAGVCSDFVPLMTKNELDFAVEIPASPCPAAFDEENQRCSST
jgi:signal transduction histidine kinase